MQNFIKPFECVQNQIKSSSPIKFGNESGFVTFAMSYIIIIISTLYILLGLSSGAINYKDQVVTSCIKNTYNSQSANLYFTRILFNLNPFVKALIIAIPAFEATKWGLYLSLQFHFAGIVNQIINFLKFAQKFIKKIQDSLITLIKTHIRETPSLLKKFQIGKQLLVQYQWANHLLFKTSYIQSTFPQYSIRKKNSNAKFPEYEWGPGAEQRLTEVHQMQIKVNYRWGTQSLIKWKSHWRFKCGVKPILSDKDSWRIKIIMEPL